MTMAKSAAAPASLSWCFSAAVLAFMMLCCVGSEQRGLRGERMMMEGHQQNGHGGEQQRACDEIYVVGDGETLHTISEKCGDPFIVENNPHIQDPDDVFPGLVIKITPFQGR
ncbi:hypothetical protein EJ110_NYTH57728 [Nymphaea thermarum]|nr:hypothetical protein EJ110_NYTH57728 [Nymphaea thermarum]